MNILDNELVRKYFYEGDHYLMTDRILEAMQQPIKKGDKYLNLFISGEILEHVSEYAFPAFHSWALRLPDRFQPKDEVEEKLKEILRLIRVGVELHATWHKKSAESNLRELVELVRKESR